MRKPLDKRQNHQAPPRRLDRVQAPMQRLALRDACSRSSAKGSGSTGSAISAPNTSRRVRPIESSARYRTRLISHPRALPRAGSNRAAFRHTCSIASCTASAASDASRVIRNATAYNVDDCVS